MEAPTPNSIQQEISQSVSIDQNNIKYLLNINSVGDIISFTLDYNSNNYSKKISLKEIKDKEGIAIFFQYSSKDFIEFIKIFRNEKTIINKKR